MGLTSLYVIIVIEIIFAFFCSFIASQKNRSGGGWFILGFLFGIIALIAIAAVPALTESQLEERNRKPHPASKADKIVTVIYIVATLVTCALVYYWTQL